MDAANGAHCLSPTWGWASPEGGKDACARRESLDRVMPEYPFRVNPETNPPQPAEVAEAIGDVIGGDDPAPDPWWRAGTDESLEE